MKKSIFDEQTSKALKKWHNAVKKKQGAKLGGKSPARTQDGSTVGVVGSSMHSSSATLHRFKTTGHSTHFPTYEDHNESDFEAENMSSPSSTANLIGKLENDKEDHTEENVAANVIERVDHDDKDHTKENEAPMWEETTMKTATHLGGLASDRTVTIIPFL